MTSEKKDQQIDRAKKLLEAHGFKLKVGACGCCQSPWVQLSHNGEIIIGDAAARDGDVNECSINMFQ